MFAGRFEMNEARRGEAYGKLGSVVVGVDQMIRFREESDNYHQTLVLEFSFTSAYFYLLILDASLPANRTIIPKNM